MIIRARNDKPTASSSTPTGRFRTAPIAHAIALTLAAGGLIGSASAQQAFSPQWFNQKGATQGTAASTGLLPDGRPANLLTGPQPQSQAARERLQTSIDNLNTAAQAIALQQALQREARNAALVRASSIPDGLGQGGLQIDDDALTRGWHNANGPVQSEKDGRVVVDIKQTADKAILNWETFNVGRNTTLNFDQQANWAVLNRVNDPTARPSEIQGQINAPGTVLILNRNGILFGGSSQVNVRNLVAAAATMSDGQFNDNGLYSALTGSTYAPSFSGAQGGVDVQAGALIQTHAPQSVTQGGGYVLLLGQEVNNAGQITTRKGQTTLAAGDDFIIRKGVATDGNTASTTRGNEVAAVRRPGSSTSGQASNSGLIVAREGDVTLAGHTVQQQGVAIATTTVNNRGTVHLLNARSDAGGSVTLGEGSTTAILIEDDGELARTLGVSDKDAAASALDSQRDALIAASTRQDALRLTSSAGAFDNLSRLSDRGDQSRVEIVSGGNVHFEGDSLTLATGGQVAVEANARTFVAEGARLDVSGAVGVNVAMESNTVIVNVQGNELRDSPANRDSGKLANSNIAVDRRDLILVPAGTGGYDADRWYLPGGLLEVGGYVSNQSHGIGEWAAQGGTITLGGNEVITQRGSQVNLAGGTLDVATGQVAQTWLRGTDGKIYNAKDAPAWMAFNGLYTGYHLDHSRWGVTENFYNPLVAPQSRLESGYTVGRDAGTLIVSAPTAILEGDINASVFNGSGQNRGRDAVGDGYKQAQTAVARAGGLVVGRAATVGFDLPFASRTEIGGFTPISGGMTTPTQALAAGRAGTVLLDADWLNAQQLGRLDLSTRDTLAITRDLTLADGGAVSLAAADIRVDATLTAHGGTFTAGNLVNATPGAPTPVLQALLRNGSARFELTENGVLDLSGRWYNGEEALSTLAYLDGGKVGIEFSGDVRVAQGSRVDVSSGGAVLPKLGTRGGKGGSVSLVAGSEKVSARPGQLTLDGAVLGYGVNGGGKLSLGTAGKVLIGDATPAASGTLALATTRFQSGFSAYDINGHGGVTVADGTTLDVLQPVYRFNDASLSTPTGTPASLALELWTPPLHQELPQSRRLVQRGGANLTLRSQRLGEGGAVEIGKGATVSVDPGATIRLASPMQMTVEGRLNAWGGAILLDEIRADTALYAPQAHSRSIWIGDSAVLDVAGRSYSALDAQGQRYGLAQAGGAIQLGGALDWENGIPVQRRPADMHLVVRAGAVLDASGSSVVLDQPAPENGRPSNALTVASNGGSIVLGSANSMFLDGTLKAQAGGKGAAGGTLALTYNGGIYNRSQASAEVLTPRMLVLTQDKDGDSLADGTRPGDALAYGKAMLAVEQIQAGGFDNLSIYAAMRTPGDLSLRMGQSLRLWGPLGVLPDAEPGRTVQLSAPHLTLGMTQYAANGSTEVAYAGSLPALTGRSDSLRVDGAHIDVFGRNEFLGFNDVAISSRGDLRLLSTPNTVLSGRTTLFAPGRMTITAAQIYAASGADGYLGVGDTNGGVQVASTPDNTLTLRSWGGPTPAVPYSVGGRLHVNAGVIEQGGVLRAPLGMIEIGDAYRNPEVHFLAGSLTSVSGAGLVMPYGGTVDGIKYVLNGEEMKPPSIGGGSAGDERELRIAGERIVVDAGAVLDMSGGGDLKGAGFVSGRGGSVDILNAALADANPAFTFSQSGNPVYALVPGYTGSHAPTGGSQGQGAPAVGRQVTLGDGVPGLPAGTYTLMPASYALLPGAFRVEIGATSPAMPPGVSATGNGSYVAAGYLGTANTDIRAALANQIILTPADVVRRHSGYNETSYNEFIIADAARRNAPRGMLTDDARRLALTFSSGAGLGSQPALTFDGTALFGPTKDGKGFGGILSVSTQGAGASNLQILADGQAPLANLSGAAIQASQLNAFNANRLVIGGNMASASAGQAEVGITGSAQGVIVRDGASLRAPEVVLTAASGGIGVLVEQGATIDTVGMGKPGFSSDDGYYFRTSNSALVVSNGWINLLPSNGETKPTIDIGGCTTGNTCSGDTRILTEGTFGVATNGAFTLRDSVRYGARDLVLAVSAVNLGSAQALAQAGAAGQLPPGMALNQDLLSSLLDGNTAQGTPVLQSLVLNVRDSFNVYGSVTLDTLDINGKSRLDRLVFGAPAIYGYGTAGDTTTIRTGEFIWAGTGPSNPNTISRPGEAVAVPPGAAILDRLGGGTLDIVADTIRFGYAPNAQPVRLVPSDRIALGFDTVNLTAGKLISTDADNGSLHVYREQNGYVADEGWRYSGGALNITTPLLSGGSAGKLAVHAGGDITISGGTGGAAAASDKLGAELRFSGRNIHLDTAVVLPSGKLVLDAAQDVTLGDDARIDLAGREITLFDVKRYSWGGDLQINSREGNVHAAAGSLIDVSAAYNRGGSIDVTALGASAGHVDLLGRLRGTASGLYDAGGTLVPYDAGRFGVRAQVLEDFAGLNQRLNEGGVFGARHVQIKQGDLVIGDEVKARDVQIALDGGALTVNGRIDASGVQVGSIRLAAKGDLTVHGTLDAHATGIRRDSYGKPIDAPNRASVSLATGEGALVLGSGAVVDLRAGTESVFADHVARGTLELVAPRVGNDDVAVDVRGSVDVRGAKTLAVYGMRRYDDAPLAAQPDVSGSRPQLVTQAWLDGVDADSRTFMDAALGNAALASRLSGLGAYRLRPGVEVISNALTNPDGNLTVAGDIDLSGYRYGPDANRLDPARRGFGEPGMLVLRAAGDVNIHGSINDGFAPPADTPDDKGWLLTEGRESYYFNGYTPFGGDIVVPIDGVVLDTGTVFPAGAVLNYEITVKPVTLPAGATVPVEVSLTGPMTLPAGQVLSADVRSADGTLYRAGTVLADALVLGQGARLAAGFLLRDAVGVGSFTLPKGAKLPVALTTSQHTTLARGAFIPSMTKVELVGDQPVNLRPADSEGRQGRNWALAPMLPEGTTSWDLTLVAGADLGSADVRMRNALGSGDIVLADTHYGSIGKVSIRFEGGNSGGGGIVLTADGAMAALGDAAYADLNAEQLNARLMADMGISFEDFWGMSLADYCAMAPDGCVTKAPGDGKSWSFNEEGALAYFGEASLAGKTQQEIDTWMQENWDMSWDYVFNGESMANVCKSSGNEPYCTGTFDNPTLNMDGAMGWIGEARFVGLTAAALDAALMEAYSATFADMTGMTLPDFCAANPSQCQPAGFEPPKEIREYSYAFGTPAYSVLRTGTGDLNLVAGRDVAMRSLYGVYTAGTQRSIEGIDNSRFNQPRGGENGKVLGDIQAGGAYDAALSAWQAWYPDYGGNLLVSAGRNILGDSMGPVAGSAKPEDRYTALVSSSGVGNWLWRQGTGSATGVDPLDTSWWINFGAYVVASTTDKSARMVGFTGFGALGGGNVAIQAGGDAGIVDGRGEGMRRTTQRAERSQGLVVAVGSTGRVVGNELVLTGGGDVDIRLGGRLNPNALASQQASASDIGGATQDNLDLNGVLTNLRGTLTFSAAGMGGMTPTFGDGGGLRPGNPFAMGNAYTIAGPVLMLGDATAWLDTRGDLVLSGAGNPGLVDQFGTIAHAFGPDALEGKGQSSFSLWTDGTAINLFSAGGDLAPASFGAGNVLGSNLLAPQVSTSVGPRYFHTYPSILRAVAPGGDIRISESPIVYGQRYDATLLLAPSPSGALELLAGGSIHSSTISYGFSMSGASQDVLSTPFRPAFTFSNWRGERQFSNLANDGMDNLFAFGPNTVTRALHRDDAEPMRFYAVNGDITRLQVGSMLTGFTGPGLDGRPRRIDAVWYDMAKAVQLRAGTDVLGVDVTAMNNHVTDVSLLQAGRDIVQSNVTLAGPGNLDLIAGGQIRQDDMASLRSIGPVVPGDTRAGASVALMAGMTDVDWDVVRTRYLDPRNLADPARPLADPQNQGKVVKVYDKELGDWLGERFGFSGTGEQALAYFDALAPEQQRIFLRSVYYAELRQGGREYNDADGPRFGSYLRGRQMIAALFPDQDADGDTITRTGDIVMFGGAGVRTDFGGDIQMLAPGGQIVVGVQGEVPPASAGVMTQGAGDIALFSEQSLSLGLSRIMTTFGGSILGWSEQGDINAGRGAKTTVLFTPPRRTYDQWGNAMLAPQVPSSGAGIATLNPIPEVPPGDVDLIAPLGTIDAGEAGIRVSGNVNLAALQVLNADNIQVQGESVGLPAIASVNISALTSASAAANSAVQAAQDMVKRQTQQVRPSVISVEVLGFGSPSASTGTRGGTSGGQFVRMPYDPANPVQFVGVGGELDPTVVSRLTPEQRQLLRQE